MQSTRIKIIWKPEICQLWANILTNCPKREFFPLFTNGMEFPECLDLTFFLPWFNAIYIFRDFQIPLYQNLHSWTVRPRDTGLRPTRTLWYKVLNWVQKIWDTYLDFWYEIVNFRYLYNFFPRPKIRVSQGLTVIIICPCPMSEWIVSMLFIYLYCVLWCLTNSQLD